jgi:hypothetical protein
MVKSCGCRWHAMWTCFSSVQVPAAVIGFPRCIWVRLFWSLKSFILQRPSVWQRCLSRVQQDYFRQKDISI